MLLCSAVKKYSRLGGRTLPCPQGGGAGSACRNILLLIVVTNHPVQGAAHAGTTSGVLRRSSRSAVCEPVCCFPSAIFHQYSAKLVARATFPVGRTQRRNQYDQRQPAMASRPGNEITPRAWSCGSHAFA